VASISGLVSFRPLRIGFLVRTTDFGEIVEATRINLCLWGGAMNPLIPVDHPQIDPRRLIDLFSVDVLHPMSRSPEVEETLKRHTHLAWRHGASESPMFGQFTPRSEEISLTCLDVEPLIRDAYARRAVRPAVPWVLVEHDDVDVLAPHLAVAFGNFSHSSSSAIRAIEKTYIGALEPERVRIPAGGEVTADLAQASLPWDVTYRRLRLYGRSGWQQPGLFVGRAGEPLDLLDFWNLRAAGVHVTFIPIEHVSRMQAFAAAMWHTLIVEDEEAPRPREWSAIWHPVGVAVPPELDSLATGSRTTIELGPGLWNGLNIRPMVARTRHESVLASTEVTSWDRPSVVVALPENPMPSDLLTAVNEQQERVVSIKLFGDPAPSGQFAVRHTLELPYLRELNEWYSREVLLDPWTLRNESDDVAVIGDFTDRAVKLYPVETVTLIDAVLKTRGIRATVSQPGRIGERLVDAMGGLDQCRLLRNAGVRRLIDSPDAREGASVTACIQLLLGVQNDEAIRGAVPAYKDVHKETPRETLSRLVDRGLLRVGLQLRCGRCALPAWHGLRDLRDEVTCEYCGGQVPVASQVLKRAPWQYRLTGLFGRGNKQGGAVPVILSLLYLDGQRRMARGVYAQGLKLDGQGVNCEADFIWLAKARDGKTEIVLGECKHTHEFDEAELAAKVERVLAVVRQLSGTSIQLFVLFATLAEEFSEPEVNALRRLKDADAQLILLGRRELENRETAWEKPGGSLPPSRHPVLWRNMVRNSIWRYLGDGGDDIPRTEFRGVER
jgi:hypothetical protein